MAVKLQPVSSSNIAAVGYDDEQAELVVEFLSGRTYRYGGVPPGEYENLLNATSVGAYFAANIKNFFRVV